MKAFVGKWMIVWLSVVMLTGGMHPSATLAAAPTQQEDLVAQAQEAYRTGNDHFLKGEYEASIGLFEEAAELSQAGGDLLWAGASLISLAAAYDMLGVQNRDEEQFHVALAVHERADSLLLTLQEQTEGDRTEINGHIAMNNYSRAQVYFHRLGNMELGQTYYTAALEVVPDTPDYVWVKLQAHYELSQIALAHLQPQVALDHFQVVLRLARETGNQQNEVITLLNMGAAYMALADYEAALQTSDEALALCSENPIPLCEPTIFNFVGELYESQGRYLQALEEHLKALTLCQEATQNRCPEAALYNNLGQDYTFLGRYEEALPHLQRGLRNAQAVGDKDMEAKILVALGFLHERQAQYREALARYHQAGDIFREQDNLEGEEAIFNNLGGVYYELGEFDDARESYEKAVALAVQIRDRDGEATALNNMGAAYAEAGKFQEALTKHQEALAIWEERGDISGQASAHSGIGFVYDSLAQYDKALAEYEQALALEQQSGEQAAMTTTLNNIGYAYLMLEEFDQARAFYDQSLALSRQLGDRAQEKTALDNIGFAYERQGQYEQALDHYLQSIEILESLRSTLAVEELQHSFLDKHDGTYARAINALWNLGRLEEAFDYAERARARALLDQLGNRQIDFRRGASPDRIRQEQALRQKLTDLEAIHRAQVDLPVAQQDQQLINTTLEELNQIRTEYEQLLLRLRLDSPEYASLVSINTLSTRAIREQVLDEHSTLISYFVTAERTFAWVIEADSIQAISLEVSRETLDDNIYLLQNVVKDKEKATRWAALLYDALIAPLVPHIHSRNLIIVPHDRLHYLPFAALWNAEENAYLLETYALTYAPSASVLASVVAHRNPNDGRILAMGNPEGNLAGATRETEAVAELFGTTPRLRGEATESHLRAQASQVDVLHIAAHGLYNPASNPLNNYVQLRADKQEDGRLEVHEIFGLDFAQANLVVLSACETALGELRSGDEIVAFNRAFLYAGTPAVITTLWAINDPATSILMPTFYRALREGATTAEALRTAQLAVLATPQWQAPHYWAAFSLMGDYRGEGQPPRPLVVPTSAPIPTSPPPPSATESGVPATPPPTPSSTQPSAGTSLWLILGGGIVAILILARLFFRFQRRK